MEPWPDQWAFLSGVSRMSVDAVAALAETARPVTAGPNLTLADLAAGDGPKPPDAVEGQMGGMLSIRRAGLPPALVAGLKHLASLANPEFHEKERMRFSTWDTPRFIRCYREDLEWIHLPRGLGEQVRSLIQARGQPSRPDGSVSRPRRRDVQPSDLAATSSTGGGGRRRTPRAGRDRRSAWFRQDRDCMCGHRPTPPTHAGPGRSQAAPRPVARTAWRAPRARRRPDRRHRWRQEHDHWPGRRRHDPEPGPERTAG